MPVLFLTQISRPQDLPPDSVAKTYLGIYVDGSIASYREELVVPLSFNGPAISLGAVYDRESDQTLIKARFTIGAAFLNNRFSHKAYRLGMELRGSWLRKLSDDQELGDFWLGACLPLQMNNLFLESWDDAHLYWLTAYMLGAALGWKKQILQDFTAMVQLEIPLVGFISRPPSYRYEKQEPLNKWTYHFSEPNRRLRFASLDTYHTIDLQAFLTRELSASVYRIGVGFQYRYCRIPSPIQTMHTSVFFSYDWGL